MASDLFEQLNPPQKEAVHHVDGPLLVFAGAGSGKTRVITYRVGNLVANHNVAPYNILAVTFTKKAAEEMMARVKEIFNDLSIKPESKPTIGTFHSIGAQILRRDGSKIGLENNFSIYDSKDSEGIVKEIMLEEEIDIKQFKPKMIASMISSAKNDLISPEEYLMHRTGFIEEIVDSVYGRYQKQLKDRNAVDFGDLLYLTTKLLKEDEEVLSKYQERYKYILVDEYQDTNTVQYNLIKMLSDKYKNLCVVGDDDQSIYKWRGADVKKIIAFESDFDNVKVVKLEQNYRSVGNVIEAAVSVITKNNERVEKSLWTDKGQGDAITVYQARDEKEEAQYLVDEIFTMQRKGYELGDLAVLYRTNFQSRVIEEALIQSGIPYKLVGGFRFYERREVKDVLSYARFINNPKDDVSLFRVINVPTRKAGPKTVSTLAGYAREAKTPMGEFFIIAHALQEPDDEFVLKNYDQEMIDRVDAVLPQTVKHRGIIRTFGAMYAMAQGKNALQVIEQIITAVRYIDYIDDGSEAGEYRRENIEELKNVASAYVERGEADSLNKFLQDIALIETAQEKNKKESYSGAITMMTLHSSKGLEFPVVFMVGMEEGILPHSRSFTEEDELEEERRLCYVGITRAKEKIFMTFSETRRTRAGFESQLPSRFLAEIPQDICDYYSWQS